MEGDNRWITKSQGKNSLLLKKKMSIDSIPTFFSHDGREVKSHSFTKSVPQIRRCFNFFLAIDNILLFNKTNTEIRSRMLQPTRHSEYY